MACHCHRPALVFALVSFGLAPQGVHAQADLRPGPVPGNAASAPADPAAEAPANPVAPEAPPDPAAPEAPASAASPWRRFEGAIGPVFTYGPEYAGGSHSKLSVAPGFFLRWGRITVSNTGAFVTRRDDDVFRGLSGDLVQRDNLRVNLALRLDRGRDSSISPALRGIRDVRATAFGRLSATWWLPAARPEDRWKLVAGFSSDLLGRDYGQVVDFSVGREHRFADGLVWTYGAGLTAASAKHLARRYGVTPAEAAVTGYPVYDPGAGLQDVSLGTGWRLAFGGRWVSFWGAGISRQLGPAAASPLTQKPFGWSLEGGIAYRF